MKIAINKCFGGFGLSDAVYKKLVELGIPKYTDWNQIPKDSSDPYVIYTEKDNDKWYSNFRDDDKRTHPLLIQAIEAVGIENASDDLAKIMIIEIPDDIQYEIDDYDGIESIHETHRSW